MMFEVMYVKSRLVLSSVNRRLLPDTNFLIESMSYLLHQDLNLSATSKARLGISDTYRLNLI